MAKAKILQDKYDAQELIQKRDNLFNEHFDRNQAEYIPSIREVTDARPLNLKDAAGTITGGQENITGTPGGYAEAAGINTDGTVNTQHPAYQAMLDRQINEAENAFQMQGTGGLPDKGSYAGSSADLSGGTLNTQHPAYAAHQNRLENLFQTQGTEGLPNKGSYAGSANSTLGGSLNLAKKDLYSADDRFRQTPQSIADIDYNARPLNRANAAANATIGGNLNMQNPAYQAMLDRQINEAENLFQNQGTGFPAETRGSFAGSSADLDAAVNQGRTGISGKNATDVTLENLNKDAFIRNELGGGSGLFNSLDPIDMALRMSTGFDTKQDKIVAHRGNETGYKDETLDGYIPVSDALDGYHYKSGKNVAEISERDTLPLGGLPLAALGHIYQQATGIKDSSLLGGSGNIFGTMGNSAYLQAVDNARGIAATGKAPALESLFAFTSPQTSEKIKTEKSEGTFKPRVVAKAKPKTTTKTKTKTKAKTTKTGPSGKTAKTIKKKTKPKTTNYTKTYTRRYGL